MKFTDRPKWKRIALAVICLIGLLIIAGGSFAAYTSQDAQRGVARNRDNEVVRFTSNYLQSCASTTADSKLYTGRTVLFADSEKDKSLSIDIFVYNYAGTTSLVNQRDITYDMTITFGGGNGIGYSVTTDTGMSVKNEDTTYTVSGVTLPGITAKAHKYTVTFPGSDLDKLKITATAKPQKVSETNNQMLAAVIAPCTGSSTQTFTFDGKFIDTSEKPSVYRGFNYEISISSGKADATLSWREDILEIDKFFLINLGKNKKEIADILAHGELKLTMNQPEGTGDYLIPFYIKDMSLIPDTDSAEEDWAEMKSMITFKANEITQ